MALSFTPDLAVQRVLGAAPSLPEDIHDAAAQIAGSAGVSWCSGQSPWLRPAAHKIDLSRLDRIAVDARQGLVRAQAAAPLVAIEAALRRSGWTLDLTFPPQVRLADAFAESPWAGVLGRRLMGLRWIDAEGRVGEASLAPTRTAPSSRVDRAVPIPRAEAVVVEALLRARPSRGSVLRRWWRAETLDDALRIGEQLARLAWPHAIVRVDAGRHVDMGLEPGRLAPVMRAALAAARTRLGGGGRTLAPAATLGVTLRAEPGVAAVWMATLEREVDLPILDDADPQAWQRGLQDALGSWALRPAVAWQAEPALGVAERLGARGRGSALRCATATLEGHGRWLVRTTTYEEQPAPPQKSTATLRVRPRSDTVERVAVADMDTAVAAVRRWRRGGGQRQLRVDLRALDAVHPVAGGGVVAGPSARLAEVERALRVQGRTLGFAAGRARHVRVLDLLLDTLVWRHAAARRASHGVGLDPAGAVRSVTGVDDLGRAGALVRWTGLHGEGRAVPVAVRIQGWPLPDRCADWRVAGDAEDLLARAHALTRRTPHLVRLALQLDDAGAELWIRTGGSAPGSARALDHLRAVLPEAQRAAPAPWPWLDAGGRLEACRGAAPPGARWVARFSRGEAVALVPGAGGDPAGTTEVRL